MDTAKQYVDPQLVHPIVNVLLSLPWACNRVLVLGSRSAIWPILDNIYNYPMVWSPDRFSQVTRRQDMSGGGCNQDR